MLEVRRLSGKGLVPFPPLPKRETVILEKREIIIIAGGRLRPLPPGVPRRAPAVGAEAVCGTSRPGAAGEGSRAGAAGRGRGGRGVPIPPRRVPALFQSPRPRLAQGGFLCPRGEVRVPLSKALAPSACKGKKSTSRNRVGCRLPAAPPARDRRAPRAARPRPHPGPRPPPRRARHSGAAAAVGRRGRGSPLASRARAPASRKWRGGLLSSNLRCRRLRGAERGSGFGRLSAREVRGGRALLPRGRGQGGRQSLRPPAAAQGRAVPVAAPEAEARARRGPVQRELSPASVVPPAGRLARCPPPVSPSPAPPCCLSIFWTTCGG